MKYAEIPLLMYHDIADIDSHWCVSLEEFKRQMHFLKEQGYKTITLNQLKKGLDDSQETDEKLVVITFDDARKGVYTHAYPILKALQFTATVYVVPQWIDGQDIPHHEAYSSFVSWEELRQLAAAGFTIGSHSLSHKNLRKLSEQEALEELSGAEKILLQQLGVKAEHFSYPYGEYTPAIMDTVSKRYTTAVAMKRGFSKDRGAYARQGVLRSASVKVFPKLLSPPTLSLCMIVKNEERFLEACLHSVQDLVNEIIIVDTGSRDKTKEIAAQFTNKVFDFVWSDDFAAARNKALQHATGDWVLILDADEIIAVEDHSTIKEALNNWDVSGHQILTRNYINATSMTGWQPCSPADHYARSYAGWFPSLKVRLFQRKEGILFEGRIHEMADASITKDGGKLTVLPVPVHHYGGDAKDADKTRRYLELSKKKVAENPDNAKAYYELGVLYKEAGQYADAEKMFLESIHRDDARLTPLFNLAVVQQKQGKYDIAIENYKVVLEKTNNTHADAHFGIGFCHYLKNELEQALTHFQQAIIHNPTFVDAYINLGAVWERLEGFQEGIDALQDAIALAPQNARAYYNLGVIYEKVGDLAQAMATYQKAIELNYIRKAELIPKVAKMKEILEEVQSQSASSQ